MATEPPTKKRKLDDAVEDCKPATSSPSNQRNASNLIWIDCEMTGLDRTKHHICEIAVLATDKDLNIIAEGPEIVIHLDEKQLSQMSEWCVEHHGKSGLTQQIKDSKIEMKSAEQMVLEFVKKYVPHKKGILCGNSIHADKQFICSDMPALADYLHYRLIDVSTIKELTRRWYPEILAKAPKKKLSHRAMDDIKESIEELQYYKKSVFIDIC